MTDVRVRIAPSPTGNLHVGTARTALFNYLFAKRHGGKFILRIEDTDIERSEMQYVQNIFDSLRALGLEWEEGPDVSGPYGPYAQMQRMPLYKEWADKLLEAGKAYYSYETPEELEAQREQAKAENKSLIYTRPTPEVLAEQKKDPSRKPSLRFEIAKDRGNLVFNDEVRNEVSFDTALMGDFVIMKSDGIPTYNFAVVVDDILMKITHIIRGEDHISNTPRQILLYEAFEQLGMLPGGQPKFAHVGMILAADKTKLSKRHGATAVSEFIAQGYLPEAFCNFLSLLGWSPTDGNEIGKLEHFATQFSLERIAHHPAIFDMAKLEHLNKQHICQLDLDDLLTRSRPFLKEFDLHQYNDDQLKLLLETVREKITRLSDLPDAVIYFFGEGVVLDAKLVGEVLMNDESRQVLDKFQKEFLKQTDFSTPEAIHTALHDFTEAMKPLKTKTVMWAIRVAITGRTQGADLSRTLYLLGKERVSGRVESAVNLIANGVT